MHSVHKSGTEPVILQKENKANEYLQRRRKFKASKAPIGITLFFFNASLNKRCCHMFSLYTLLSRTMG